MNYHNTHPFLQQAGILFKGRAVGNVQFPTSKWEFTSFPAVQWHDNLNALHFSLPTFSQPQTERWSGTFLVWRESLYRIIVRPLPLPLRYGFVPPPLPPLTDNIPVARVLVIIIITEWKDDATLSRRLLKVPMKIVLKCWLNILFHFPVNDSIE